MNSKIPFIKVFAKNHKEFGYEVGKKLSGNIKTRIEANKKIYMEKGMGSFSELFSHAKKFLTAIQEEFPDILEELRSMAEGAEVPFEALFVLNCEEEMLNSFIPHCTSLAVQTPEGEILIAHNDDWMPGYRENGLYMVEGHINDHAFLALSYMGALPGNACGLNNQGLAYTVNSLDYNRFRNGIPRNFLLRAMLEAKSLKEAEKLVTDRWRSICANTLLAYNDCAMEDVESLWCRYEIFHGNNHLVHTNHPLKKEDQNRNNTDAESLKRFDRVCELLEGAPRPTEEDLKNILRDHKAEICGHHERATVASAIINPKERWMDVCYANPCKHHYHRYTLE